MADFKRNPKDALNVHENNSIKAEVASALALIEELSTKSSDSGLSEDTCWEIFGGPCPEGLRKKIRSFEKNSILKEEADDLLIERNMHITENEKLKKEQDEENISKQEQAKTNSWEKEPKEGDLKKGSLENATLKDITHKEGSLNKGSLKEGSLKHDSLNEGSPKRSLKQETFKEGSLNEGNLKEGDLREGSLKDDTLNEGSSKRRDLKEGSFKGDSPKEGNLKESDFKEGSLKKDSLKEDSLKKGSLKEGSIKADIRQNSLKESEQLHKIKKSNENGLSEEIKLSQKDTPSDKIKGLSQGSFQKETRRESGGNGKIIESKIDEKGTQKESNVIHKMEHKDSKRNSQESQNSKKNYKNSKVKNVESKEILRDEELMKIEDLSDSMEEYSKSKATQESPTTISIGSGRKSISSKITDISTSVSSNGGKKLTDTVFEASLPSHGSKSKYDTSESSDLQACNCICCIERQIRKSHKKELKSECFKKEVLYCQCCNNFLSTSNNKFELKVYNEDGLAVSGDLDSCKKGVRIKTFDYNNPKSRNRKIQTSMFNMFNENRTGFPCCHVSYNNDSLYLNQEYSRPAYSKKLQKTLPTSKNKTIKKNCKCSGDHSIHHQHQSTEVMESFESNEYDEDSASSSKSSCGCNDTNQKQYFSLADSLKAALLKRSVKETVRKFENKNNYALNVYTESSHNYHQPLCKHKNSKYKEENNFPTISKNRKCGCCCREPKPILKRRPNVPIPTSKPCTCCDYRNRK